MQEYSRSLIEEYCMEHNSAKSRRLQKLVRLSYDPSAEGTDADEHSCQSGNHSGIIRILFQYYPDAEAAGTGTD